MDEREELEMLRDAVQVAESTVIVTDPNRPDNPIIYVNRGFEVLTGYSREEVLGRNCRFLQGGDHDQPGVRRVRTAIERREAVSVELRNYRKDGSMFWNELHLSPVFRGGALRYFFGVQNDVTHHKEADTARELLHQAVENAGEALVITDARLDPPGPRMVYVNPAFSELTGYRREEVLGRTPRLLQGPETDRAVLDRLRGLLERGEPFLGETTNYRKDGTPFILEWNIAPIRDPQGRVTHWVSTHRDVTERRGLERELLDVSAREQQRIASDLHDTLQQHLIGTAMQTGHLVRALRDRAPDLSEEAQGIHTLVQEAVEAIRSVVQGVMPIQRSGNGLMVALDTLVQHARAFFSTKCVFTFEKPLLVPDYERAIHLYHIAQEAVNNAARHAEASLIEVRLAEAEGGHVLSVRDDGVGMPEEANQEGGMGLNIMAYRARLIGARLEVSSQPGRGTTVRCAFE